MDFVEDGVVAAELALGVFVLELGGVGGFFGGEELLFGQFGEGQGLGGEDLFLLWVDCLGRFRCLQGISDESISQASVFDEETT